MERPSRGGEKRTAVWASPHEERGSDGAVAPPMCDHRVVLHRCVVREWCHPSGAAVAPGLHTATRTRRAARAVQGDVVSVWQVLPPFLRTALPDLTTIAPVTAYYRINYVRDTVGI